MNNYKKSSRQNGEAQRAFRHFKGLMLAAAMLAVLISFILLNMGVLHIQSRTVLASLPAGSQQASQTSGSPFTVWVSPSLVRVGPTDAAGTASSITVSGARGETLDTQVILQAPAGGLTNVNLSASALTGPGGATIPASNLVLYREYYVAVQGSFNAGGNNPPLGPGTYPEPLIPFVYPETCTTLCGNGAPLQAFNASVAANQNQPFWIYHNMARLTTNVSPG